MTDLYKETISTYNHLGKRYIRRISRAVPRQRARFMKMFPANAKVLDVGSAGGRDSKVFARRGFQVVGIDASDVFVKEAEKYSPRVKFLRKDLRSITFPAYSFDGIWANAVLMHLKRNELARVLKNFYRILKSGGIVHVAVKQGRGSRLVKEILSQDRGRFFTFFTKKEIEALLCKVGFKIIYSAIAKDELKRVNVPWVVVWGQKS